MKLTAIEAARYGALENGCLNGVGDGLTVVLGPNESGKSTFTSLARHVLYGFPDARKRERGYVPASGGRHARLVFADESGEWAVERIDGPHRGPVTVTARRGGERPGLLGEVTGGVSEQTYHVVFGFGLDELALIESADNADIVSRLYAAGSGLAVNPLDVRKQLEQRAGALYAPRASKPRLNALAARMRELRDQIRTLEIQAADYAADQVRLRDLSEQLEPLRRRRDSLEGRLATIERDTGALSSAAQQLRTLGAKRADLSARCDELGRSIELITVDEAVLSAGPGLRTVLEETSGFSQRLAAIAQAEGLAAEAQHRIDGLVGLPPDVVATPALRSAVERWRERLADLRRRAADAAEAATERQTLAEQTELAAAGNVPTTKAPRARLVGIVLCVVGLIGAGAGVWSGQWIAAALGVVVALGGVLLAVVPPSGETSSVLPDEIVRLRADAQSRSVRAQQAASDLDAASLEWGAWLADNGLSAAGGDPHAVVELIDSIAVRDGFAAERDRHLAVARRERDLAEQWVVRLVDAVRVFDSSASQIPALSAGLELAARAKATLERAKDAQLERRELERSVAAVTNELRSTDEQIAVSHGEIAQIASRYGLDETDVEVALDALRSSSRNELGELKVDVDERSREVARLGGELGREGRDDAMARARQELEGLGARAQEAADVYVVTALAVRLLDRTRECYERERQPAVVRNAARVFSAMTDGRYTDVRAPLDGSGVTVRGADGSVRSTAQLSRGTAEQLYLALRVGLIGSLGEQGRWLPVFMDDVVVNFDPQRRTGAIQAVAELASMRQVLFFTCHPETADALVGQVDGTTLIALDRCAL